MRTEQDIFEEIKEIASQYHAEVGRGRKAWPNSVKDRVGELYAAGVKATTISRQTGLPYFTVLRMRPKSDKGKPRGRSVAKFKELTVVAQKSVATVTVPSQSIVAAENKNQKVATVTVTTPQGLRIEMADVATATALIKSLMQN